MACKFTVINVKNPPALSLGENRVYFGLWSLMKSPLLLSSDLPSLTPDLLAIVNNTEVIAIKCAAFFTRFGLYCIRQSIPKLNTIFN